ncbi:MAG: hypothetical protein M1839_002332 [Geoglossum umbratile]|nr:MAG: hypothetical protein M1839_002332 [Geoglossum umbratile]
MAPATSGKLGKGKKDEGATHDRATITTQPPTNNGVETKLSGEDAPPASLTKKRKRESKPMEEIEVDVAAPEPPSKKALRRAKKGKPITTTASKSAGKGGAHISDVDSDEGGRSKRSDHGIWIGNLPFTFTKADLRKFLTENSSITDDQITRVHLPAPNGTSVGRKLKPQNKGFAYIDFSTESVLKEALELSETLISGRRVLIKNAKSFEGRPEKANDSTSAGRPELAKSGKPSKKIFVGNLSFDTTEEDLREHFGRCGEVKTVFVATFEDSGKCKGFAWAEFEELEAAEAAVRGWVKVPIDEEEEDDSEAKEDSDGGKENQKEGTRMRKWWVNRIRGRALRMEFAEDKVIRYKKRYGKDGTARATTAGHSGEVTAPETTAADGISATVGISEPRRHTSGKERLVKRSTGVLKKIDARTIKPGAALANAQRMTGGIVESKGKKITFDD